MHPLHPDAFPYHRAELTLQAGGRTWRLAALDGFEANVGPTYRHLGGRRTEREPGDWMPMFGVLWPGAAALCDRVAVEVQPGETVLELGCGLGVPSLVAASLGARPVATDNHPHAGVFLGRNARANGVPIDPDAPPAAGAVTYAHLDWRHPAPALPPGGFDRVIASDLLFSPDLAPLVASMVARFLAPDGHALLIDPGRLALPAFEEGALAAGLSVDVDAVVEGAVELYEVRLRRR